MMGTRQPPPVSPRTTITLQPWKSATVSDEDNFVDDQYARSTSTDSLESSSSSSSGGGGSSNRIAEVGSGEYIPTRTVGMTPKLPSRNPLQFVKVQSPLYKKAEQQIKLIKEVKITREALKEGEEEWQSNLDNWKSRRRKVSEKVIQRAEEMRQIEAEEQMRQDQILQQQKKIRKFSEIIEKKSARSYNLDLYIGQGDDSGLGGTPEPEDILDSQNGVIRSDTSEGMTSEAESVESDNPKNEKTCLKEPPKVPQKPYSRLMKTRSLSYDTYDNISNTSINHCFSRQELLIAESNSSAEPSDVEGHAADIEATSSEEDAAFSGQTGDNDSRLGHSGDIQGGSVTISSFSHSSRFSLEKSHEPNLDVAGSKKKFANVDADVNNISLKICIKPGDNGGFGFTLKSANEQGYPAAIENVVEGGPADEVGLKSGDKIIALNGELTTNYSHASLLFSIKQAVYTGILHIVVNRSENQGDANNKENTKDPRKCKSFAEKLALFSASKNTPSVDGGEMFSSAKLPEDKHESLVLRRRSAFENGKTDSASKTNYINSKSSFILNTTNSTFEKKLEKRHSVDVILSPNIAHENSVCKKGPPPPVPVKPKIRSRPKLSEVSKTAFSMSVSDNDFSPSINIREECENVSSRSQNVFNFSNGAKNYDLQNQVQISSNVDNSFDGGLTSDVVADVSNTEVNSHIVSSEVQQETSQIGLGCGFQQQTSDTVDNRCIEPNSVITDFEPNYIENSDKNCVNNYKNSSNSVDNASDISCDISAMSNIETSDNLDKDFSQGDSDIDFISRNIYDDKNFVPYENISLLTEQSIVECDFQNNVTTNIIEECLESNDLDEEESILKSASQPTCDKNEEDEVNINESDNNLTDKLEAAEVENSLTNPSPLCLSLEKIDEDDAISASTTTSSDTPDTETVIETLPSNLSPLPNDESNGEDSSKLAKCQDGELVHFLETEATDQNTNSELNIEDSSQSLAENANISNGIENETISNSIENETISNSIENETISNMAKNENFSNVDLKANEDGDQCYMTFSSENDNVFEDKFYSNQQDDEYARELDESLDQITSLDIIDRIEQSLMDQLQKDDVYEDLSTNINNQLELDINRPWLLFPEETEFFDDLTPQNLEPPRDPPPPPPPPETENDDSNVITVSGTDSTKRIKKEIWRRRSDFLGINAPETLDIDNILPPPPGLEELLKQEREQTQWLEKQLSLPDLETELPSIDRLQSLGGDSDYLSYNKSDYSEYYVDEDADGIKSNFIDSQTEELKENDNDEAQFENTFGLNYEEETELINNDSRESFPKANEKPIDKAKQNIQNLGAAPKAKIMDSAKWITEKVDSITKTAVEPVFRRPSYNQSYWLAQDSEQSRNVQLDSHVDRRYSLPPVYSNTHVNVKVRAWGDSECEYQQHRPRSAIYERPVLKDNVYEKYMNMEKDELCTQNVHSQQDDNLDTDTLESEVHKCSCCGKGLCEGSAMGIEALSLYFHIECFRCCLCHIQLGNGSCGTDVQVKNNHLYCPTCFTID